MNNRERLAREWAAYYKDDFPKFTEGSRAAEIVKKAKAAAEYILATTTPPTMAEEGWDDSEHFLSGAVDPDGCEVVMLGMYDSNVRVCDVGQASEDCVTVLEKPESLTPNGKRYELVDVTDQQWDPEECGPTVSQGENVAYDQPKHPKVLRTVEDLKAAPDGTVISQSGEYVLLKQGIVWAIVGDVRTMDSGIVAAGLTSDANVLRWGWGE